MRIELTIEEAGEEGTILSWHKQPGEQVTSGEILVEVETAKSTLEIEASENGQLIEVHKHPGDTITSNDIVAIIETN